MSSIVARLTPFASIIQRPNRVRLPSLLAINESMERTLLLSRLPGSLTDRLKPTLHIGQLRSLERMHSRDLQPPEHWFKQPKFTIPERGVVPELSVALRKCGGRNHHGHITVRHRGGGFKRRIRLVDTRRLREGAWTVIRIEHDPNRSAKLALLKFADKKSDAEEGEYCYVLCADGMKAGDVVTNGAQKMPTVGSSMRLADIPTGTVMHSVEVRPGRGGVVGRAAGTKVVLLAKEDSHATIKLPSGKQCRVSLEGRACIGPVGNAEWRTKPIGSAGRNRRLGKRPTVRGAAMNAVDHPHGGGKGGRGKGKPSQSPWGWTC